MTEDAQPPILSRPLKVDEIRDGASDEIAVTGAELVTVAKMLDLVALDRLTFAYRIDRGGGGRLVLTGTLNADAKQTCVVSLEPVEARLEVPVEMEFWPAELLRPERDTAEGRRRRGFRLARGDPRRQDRSRTDYLRDPRHGARSLSAAPGGALRLAARRAPGGGGRRNRPICVPCRSKTALEGP